jgi:hypothetical protein
MAKILIKNPAPVEFGGTPYGNTQVRPFTLKTTETGVPVGSNPVKTIEAGDTVALGALRAGMHLHSAVIIVSQGVGPLSGRLGFAYADGVDDTPERAKKEGRPHVPQDLDYFFVGQSLAAAIRKPTESTKAPVTLPKDAVLTWTNTSGVSTGPGQVDILVYGEDRGAL